MGPIILDLLDDLSKNIGWKLELKQTVDKTISTLNFYTQKNKNKKSTSYFDLSLC